VEECLDQTIRREPVTSLEPIEHAAQRSRSAELRRQDLLEATARYLDELVAEVGAPSPEAVARAEALSPADPPP